MYTLNVKCLLATIALCLFSTTVFSLEQQLKSSIDDFVTEVVRCRNVPGLSLAVVTSDDDPTGNLVRGYGLADIQNNITAENNTAFALGSLTKAFTITLLASLLSKSKGKYSWDTPVREIMGDNFRFFDADRTRMATIRDLAAHKMGLMSYVLPAVAGLDDSHSAMDYCRRVRYLQVLKGPTLPPVELRTVYVYSNFMYMVLGCVAEKIGQDTYSNLLHKYVLKPLEMTSSVVASDVMNWTAPQYALPYVPYKGNLTQISTDVARGLSPLDAAGSLFSTANDMTKWLRFHMGLSGVTLADAKILQQVYLPQFSMGGQGGNFHKPTFPFSDEKYAYNMGWVSGSYRGYRYIEHGGLISGYGAELRIYLDKKVGIFVDTNGPMYLDAYYARMTTVWYLSDKLLDLEPIYNTSIACSFPNSLAQQSSSYVGKNDVITAKAAPKDPLPIAEEQIKRCIGVFGSPLFGNVTVTRDKSNSSFLELKFGKLVRSQLGATPWADPRTPDLLGGSLQGDLWYFLETGPKPFKDSGVLLFAYFYENTDDGKIKGFQNLTLRLPVSNVEAPITFIRGLTWADGDKDPVPIPVRPDCNTSSGQSLAPLNPVISLCLVIVYALRIVVYGDSIHITSRIS